MTEKAKARAAHLGMNKLLDEQRGASRQLFLVTFTVNHWHPKKRINPLIIKLN